MGKVVELLAEDTAAVGRDLFVLDMEGGREDALLHVDLLLFDLLLCRPGLSLTLETRSKEIW